MSGSKITESTTEPGQLLRAIAAAPAIAPPVPVDETLEPPTDGVAEPRTNAGSAEPGSGRAGSGVSEEPTTLVLSSQVEALGLRRWGLRFERDEVETTYRVHHQQAAVPFTRVGMVVALLVWAAYVFVARVATPDSFERVATFSLLVTMPLIAASFAMTYVPRLIPRMLSAVAVTNAVAGMVAVGLCVNVAHRPDVAMGVTMIACYFGFTIFRMRAYQAALSTLPYVLFNQWLLIDQMNAGRLVASTAILYSVTADLAFLTGLPVCALLERLSRQAFRQDRIIEMQRAALDQERAHAARLQEEARIREVHALEEEVRRHVAEKSRDLAESLLRLKETPHAPVRLMPGDIVEDRYRIIRVLGEGGMGQVHEVERLADGRRMALKVMTRAARRDALVRFAREAQIAAQIDHPNLVGALDIGVTRSGTLFLVMQLVTGTTLAHRRRRYGDGAWAAPVLLQVARALGALHGQRILHRDLKPSNILLDGDVVKVADFGIASLMDADPGVEALTSTGAIVGTPLYMAPELSRGVHDATPAADMFSFGVIAYELLSTKLPYSTPPVIEAVHGRPMAAIESLVATARGTASDTVLRLVDRCLSVAPEERPSADDLECAVAAFCSAPPAR